MGEFEAVGDAVTGGLVGRAVEPGAGEPGADGHTHERNCLNCGTALTGDYCHACGQRAHVHRTLSAFFHDLMHGVLHFEGKIWNTLPMLAWKPGELTRRYIEGERAKFVSPMALFLFSVFLMFAVAGFGGGIATTNTVEVRKGIGEEIAVSEAKLKQLQAQHDDAVRKGVDTKDVDAKIADLQQQAAVLRGLEKGEIATASGVRFDGLPDWFRKPAEQAGKNPELLFYKLKTSAYKYSWLLIPFSVPFLWLMFPFSRRFRIYDHTVFVTYSLSFMTLLVVIGILVGFAGAPALTALLFLIPPVHMYRQLKGAYGLTRGGALLRTFLLIGFAMVAAVLFAVALVGLGIFD
jgi:hypothetical protein